tara:strand:+ start:382 stop:519 length:138 start_codon:yes stop_codon:yes gene_type:complete
VDLAEADILAIADAAGADQFACWATPLAALPDYSSPRAQIEFPPW